MCAFICELKHSICVVILSVCSFERKKWCMFEIKNWDERSQLYCREIIIGTDPHVFYIFLVQINFGFFDLSWNFIDSSFNIWIMEKKRMGQEGQ